MRLCLAVGRALFYVASCADSLLKCAVCVYRNRRNFHFFDAAEALKWGGEMAVLELRNAFRGMAKGILG